MSANQLSIEEEFAMRVGIIRCQQTEDLCPGNTDFKIAAAGAHAFAETGPMEVMGFVSCGGCPGKRAVARARIMVERGAKAIVFASCISRGNPIGMACPHFASMRESIRNAVGAEIALIDYTHRPPHSAGYPFHEAAAVNSRAATPRARLTLTRERDMLCNRDRCASLSTRATLPGRAKIRQQWIETMAAKTANFAQKK
jgi:predicted metal-binding protein